MTLSVGLPTIKTTKSNNYNRITSEIYQHFTIGRTYNISEFLIRCSPQWDTVKKNDTGDDEELMEKPVIQINVDWLNCSKAKKK